jgi:hypothetical protein
MIFLSLPIATNATMIGQLPTIVGFIYCAKPLHAAFAYTEDYGA